MQAAAFSIAIPVLPLAPKAKPLACPPRMVCSSTGPHTSSVKATATATLEASTVDYTSMTSVFPAEACETIGGDACLAEMYPEAKLEPVPKNNSARVVTEAVEREYLEYNDPKTVFLGEACDDLGGEFCQWPYQGGVY